MHAEVIVNQPYVPFCYTHKQVVNLIKLRTTLLSLFKSAACSALSASSPLPMPPQRSLAKNPTFKHGSPVADMAGEVFGNVATHTSWGGADSLEFP